MQDEMAEAMSDAYRRGPGCFNSNVVSSAIEPAAGGSKIGSVSGTADDLFAPTNEAVAQIRARVLPIGATINGVTIFDDNSRAPLYTKTAGFASLNLQGSCGSSWTTPFTS